MSISAAVFEAVADPTRRALLDRLRSEGSLSVNALANGLPMTRQAVTKHLDALRAAGLVHVTRRGRERLHDLDDAPLRDLATWLAPYAAEWDRRLVRLERHLEDNP